MRTKFRTRRRWSENETQYPDFDAVKPRRTSTDDEIRGTDLLRRVLEAKDRAPFSKRLLKEACGFKSSIAVEVVRMLLQYNTHPIDEDVAIVAVGNRSDGARMTALLLDYNKNIVISDRMMLEAAKNSSQPVISLLLQQPKHPRVTEEIIKAAIAEDPFGYSANPWLVQLLLKHSNGLNISQETIILAMDWDGSDGEVLKNVLDHQATPITEKLIEAALRTGCYAVDLLTVLFIHGRGIPASIDQELRFQVYTTLKGHPQSSMILAKLGGNIISTDYTPQIESLATGELEEVITTPMPASEVCPTCLNLQSSNGYVEWKRICYSGMGGCRYCLVIQQGVQQTLQVEMCPNQEIRPRYSEHKDLQPLRIQILTCFGPTCCPQNQTLDWRNKDNLNKFVDVYMHEGTRQFSPAIGAARDVSPDASTDECMALANKWLKECIANHPMCPSPSTSLPLRVIRVGSEQIDPVLYVTSKSDHAHYTALSHCWGGWSMITTTVATLEERKQSIPMASLPKTFRDAVITTRRLGIEYLWIDSLCILQDSTEDWAREAAKMAAVYSGAAVVIAADAAQSSVDGCFGPYQQGSNRNLSVTIHCVDDQGLECKVYARKATWRKYWNDLEHFTATEYSISPLSGRGWALQERLLPSRILHYGFTELAWECWSQVSCECIAVPEEFDSAVSNHVTRYRAQMVGSLVTIKPNCTDNRSYERIRWDNWYNLVKHFTQLELSYHSDRLAALSGLAATLGPPDGYICGLWRSEFMRGLMWWVKGSEDSRASYMQEAYIAPSWSWGSVTGEIDVIRYVDLEETEVDILDVHYTLANSNPFGAVNQACVMARGCLLPIWLDTDFNIHFGTENSLNDLDLSEREKSCLHVRLDVTSGDRAQHEFIVQEPLQLLILQRGRFGREFVGIVLRVLKGELVPNTFQRVGYAGHAARTSRNFEVVYLEVLCDTTESQIFRWI